MAHSERILTKIIKKYCCKCPKNLNEDRFQMKLIMNGDKTRVTIK
jgi:hypothetical protein